MNIVAKITATLAPRWALSRLQARRGVKAFYEAGTPSRLHKKRVDNGSADNVVKQAGKTLRVLARDLEQNYDIARGALDILVDKTVGLGIRPEPQIRNTEGKPHKEVNQALTRLWKDWIKDPEVTGDFDYYSAQRMAARHLYRDGEVFIQLLSGNVKGLNHHSKVPFSFEMLDADFVPHDLDDERKGINQGIAQNKWRRATAYHVYKEHPQDIGVTNTQDTKRIAADKMIHVKCVDRIRQTRGVSVFASVMNRFDDVKEIEESERVAARVAAAMAGYIKKGTPDLYVAPADGESNRGMEFTPGIIFDDLQVGEDVGTIQSNRPNNALIPFRNSQLRAAASGMGCGYSSLSKDYNGTYSAQRQELVEGYEHYGVLWQYFTNKACDPMWRSFVRNAIAAKLITFPKDMDMDTLFDVDHSRPVMPWVDPDKEMKGVEGELRNNLASKSQVIRRRGGNPDDVRQQIASDIEDEEALGITKAMEGVSEPDKEPDDDDDPPPKKDDDDK